MNKWISLLVSIVFLTNCIDYVDDTFITNRSVALTFDDGPDAVYTPMILNILKEKDVKATFFLVGNNMKKYPDVTKRIINEGHTVGNHTMNHMNITKKSFAEV